MKLSKTDLQRKVKIVKNIWNDSKTIKYIGKKGKIIKYYNKLRFIDIKFGIKDVVTFHYDEIKL